MLKYKINVLEALKEKGYSPIIIRREKLIGEASMTEIRHGRVKLSTSTIDTLCRLLCLQPGDILEYIPDEPQAQPASADEMPDGAEDIF